MSGSPKVGPTGNSASEANTLPAQAALERHFSVSEIAAMWNLSVDAVRKLFRNEPGVLVIGDSNPRGKRRYLTTRVPATVVERVHRRLSLSKQ
jgi:hypothetical protein